MKRSVYFLASIVAFLTIVVLGGCSKDNNPIISNPPSKAFLWVHFESDSVKVEFATLPKIDAGGAEAIQLSEFVDTTLIPLYRDKNGNAYDSRTLFAYQIVADDGFSASGAKGFSNNIWSHMQLGHILTTTRQVVFPDDKIDLAGAYNVKNSLHIYIHRKLDLERPDSTKFVELRSIDTVQIENFEGNLENAIPLKDVVLLSVDSPQIYSYNLRTLDDFGPSTSMTWDQFQTGYWLLTSGKTRFTDALLVGGAYKLKVLESIQIIP
jgi:hypothetical protein